MYTTETGIYEIRETRNQESNYSEDVERFLTTRNTKLLQSLEHNHQIENKLRRTEEEQRLRNQIKSRILDNVQSIEDFKRLKELQKYRIEEGALIEAYPDFLSDGIGILADPVVAGKAVVEMWWASTTIFFDSANANAWYDNEGDRFAVKYTLDDGDLHKYDLKVVARFEIKADRMPAQGRSYLSAPMSEVLGPAYGYTLTPDLFDFGDNWSKCWLNTKQTVLAFTPMFPGIFGSINSESRQIINIEDGGPQKVSLPGLLGMPPCRFFLPVNCFLLMAELEWHFHIQLEGAAGLMLGHTPQMQACTIKHPQWFLAEA